MKILDCEQGSREWALARRGVATASNASRIISPVEGKFSKSAYDYACELLVANLIQANWWVGGDDDFQSEAMAHGTRTEREARAYFELETGLVVREVGFIAADDGRSGCSPDGVIGELPDMELLELKCPLHKTQVKYLDKGTLPDEYKPQVHWSLAVTGCRAVHFMSYALGLPKLILRIEPDDYTKKVIDAMGQFFTLMSEIKGRVDGVVAGQAKPEPEQSREIDMKRAFPLTG